MALDAKDEVLREAYWNKLRLIIAHDPKAALQTGSKRDSWIQELQKQASQWVGKLDDQDAGKHQARSQVVTVAPGPVFCHEVCEAHLARIVRVDLQSELFTYSIYERALKHAQLMDGKLLLVTNVADLAPKDVVRRYKPKSGSYPAAVSWADGSQGGSGRVILATT